MVNSHLLCQLSYWGSIVNALNNKDIISSQAKMQHGFLYAFLKTPT